MSKNLTRKGLALSAVVALGTSLFAGAPAQAAGALLVAPNAGTSYNVLASDSFTVKAYGNSDLSAITSTTLLRWKVTKPSASSTVVFTDQAGSPSVVADSTDASIVYVTPSAVSATVGRNTLGLAPATTSTTGNQAYKVQAYLDLDNNGKYTAADDLGSVEQTINFKSDLVPTVALDPIGAGQTVTGKITYGTDFNYEQTTLANSKVLFTVNGVEDDAAVAASAAEATYLSLSSSGAITAPAAGQIVSVVAKSVRFDGDATFAVSAAVTGSTATATATDKENTVTAGANIYGSGTSWKVRTGTTAFTYKVKFLKTATTAVAAGQPVTIKVRETAANALDTTDVVKVNGTQIPTGAAGSNRGDEKIINTVTETGGIVTINVTSTLGQVGDAFTIDTISGGVASNSLTFTYEDAALTALKESSLPLVASASSYTRTIVRLGTVSASYALVDQFGQKWTSANTATTYRLKATLGAVQGAATWATVYADFAAGVATATITDNSTANTTYQISVSVDRRQDGAGSWGDSGLTVQTIKVTPVTAAAVASKIALGVARSNNKDVSDADGVATNSVARSTATLVRVNRLVDDNTDSSLAVLDAQGATITGVVTRADGGVAAGVAVTIAAPGVWFSTDAAGSTYVVDNSITTVTDVTGAYKVYAFSNTGGTKTFTTTSGSATATQKIKFAAAAANAGTAIAITAPAYSAAGRSVDVVVALTDKFGAPVQSSSASPLRVSVSGAGSNTTIAADSDEDGLVSFKLIFGANETGVATIKATYDLENDGTIDVTKTATVTIGSAPAAAGTAAVSGSTGKFYVSATAAAGKLVVVKVAGKFVTSFKATGSKKSVAVKSSKGSKKVTVFVSGKLAATKTVTVK